MMHRLDPWLKPRASETRTRLPTIAHDKILGGCHRGISAILA
jgi:hypothetical protein